MVKVIGVRFKKVGKIYYFDPCDFDIELNDFVIVETARGVEFGITAIAPKLISESDIVSPLKKVIRIAEDEDFVIHRKNMKMAKEAHKICETKVAEHGLDMRIIDVEYTFDNNKIIFYFTADGRIDFRNLVKDLAAIFKTRIELRQIGVRDEAKMLGGLGPCGKPCCCVQFLGEFEPVSIKMAKEQDLSLNPAKISGLCGRLMCCLKYEEEAYEDALSRMPSLGDVVITEVGTGTIVYTYTLLETVKVRVKLEDGTEDVLKYPITDIKLTGERDKSFLNSINRGENSQEDF